MLTRRLISKFSKQTIRNFSVKELSMPIIDLTKFINKSEGWEKDCKTISDCLHETGILVVKDPVNKY
jgi:hypothetical protein